MKLTKILTLGAIVILSGCVGFLTPSATPSSGNVASAMDRWDSSARAHPDKPAPQWTKDCYADELKTINHLESEIKELKTGKP